jgi:hypothetical protein
MYRPERAVSICVSRQPRRDQFTGEEYMSAGSTTTFDPHDGAPKILVDIRAAGMAAESLVYGQTFDDIMNDPDHRFEIKTDTDNAMQDLHRAQMPVGGEQEFRELYWNTSFNDARLMLSNSLDKLLRIADYCEANPDREIPAAEIVEACDL